MIHSIRAVAERPTARRWLLATGLTLGLVAAMPSAKAQDTIKVGILHSLSGTMAISETTLKDVMLMLIEEQNKKGGVLGKKLEAVVVDPASNWPLFAEKARELITKDKVSVVFGCWTSVSRNPLAMAWPASPKPMKHRLGVLRLGIGAVLGRDEPNLLRKRLPC